MRRRIDGFQPISLEIAMTKDIRPLCWGTKQKIRLTIYCSRPAGRQK